MNVWFEYFPNGNMLQVNLFFYMIGDDMALRIFFASMLIVFAATLAQSDELHERERLRSTAAIMLLQGQFDLIDETARHYRESEERFASGIWKLSSFYGGIFHLASLNVRSDDGRQELDALLQRYLDQNPDSPSAVIFQATSLRAYAWEIRGGAYLVDVDPLDRVRFRRILNEAAAFLETKRTIGAVDPHWFDTLAGIYWEQGENRKAMAVLFKGIEKFPRYYPLYFTGMRFLSPRWGGSPVHLEVFANFAVGKTRESDGTGMYARAYWASSGTHYFNGDLFTGSMVNWDSMRESMRDVLEHYPSDWNVQNFAYFSCLKGDADMARQMLGQIEADPIPSVWERGISFRECQAIAGL